MDHYTRSFPTDAQQAPGTGDRDPPDFLAFLAETDLLPLATYLQLQNRALDGKASESDTLISLGLIELTRLAQLHAEHLAEGYIDRTHFSPNPDLLKILGPATALKMGVLPWRLSTGVTVILTDRPEHYDQNQAYLREIFGPLRRAFAPAITFLTFALWGTLTLIANMALKLTTAILFFHRRAMDSFKYQRRVTDAPLPKISIMVPLFKESAIMNHLLANLRQLDYPKTLLQVILVMERDDITTAKTLARTRLPPWITSINVPGGHHQNKAESTQLRLRSLQRVYHRRL